ncbi:UDP-N-acetylmuramoyl-L-alanyl-D-glutamate--2,6-diaminopimelate ligase [Halobacillus campisalis]|uniref:UDP-N-acetylmuramyl-tripeptide synthetase n=1 Tax=Halobacillus campisalis TaxID=435909 RepID=A0ABW2K778_9BACI|nr:UDP-N-acetylmuramoyl-L-alanyl-D-glutamate--2,6-diaminopimelate ligase [Halobacillus campisalis]
MKIEFNQVYHIGLRSIYGPSTQTISNLMFHSKHVKEGSVFFSIRGENQDGHEFIDEAIANGAVAVVGDHDEHLESLSRSYPECSFVLVEDVRKAMAYMSKHFYGRPDEKLLTIGVTGTNGKTTVSAYVRSLLNLLEKPTGLVGTTGIWSSKEKFKYKKSTPTTPEAIDLHHIFSLLDQQGDVAASMEVSSIALDQKRVEGITFDVAIHTNFSEEHLEYHKTIDHYKACKLKLFAQARCAVVNADDEGMGKEVLELFEGPKIIYSLLEESNADLKASHLEVGEKGSYFKLDYKGETCQAFAPVYGTYNISNVLSAIGAALHFGYSIKEIVEVLPQLKSPEGRFQVIQADNHPKVILDYAHTPVALTRLVEEVKKLKYNKLIVMIAGIGIRDFKKMPKMAAIIEGKADEIIVTVDHPGFHDPQIIVDQVMTGFKNPDAHNIHTALTREEGVRKSLHLGQADDIILLTSGCINNAQIIKGKEIPHSDEAIIEAHYLQSS